MKILFASPSRALSQSMVGLLSLVGHEVDVAYDGVQALAALQQGAYDVFVAERDLPRLDAVRVLQSSPALAVGSVAILPKSCLDVSDLTADGGFDVLLPKPFSAKTMLTALARMQEEEERVFFGDVHLDYRQRAVYVGEKSVHCTLEELDVLRTLLQQNGASYQDLASYGGTRRALVRLVRAINAKLASASLGLTVQPASEGYKVGRV